MVRLSSLVKYLLLLLLTCAYAQELPPIENYAPEDYGAGNQNWAISQSDEKYIYVANNSGLIEFNGANWKLYPSPNGTIIRSVKVINDLIYTGCYMEFGFWEKDEFGNLIYNSLKDKLHEPLIEDEHFWNIMEFDDWVLFQSLDRIYVYNTIDGSFNIINSKSTRAKIFEVGKTIYFQKINEGIFKIENGIPLLVSSNPIVKKNTLVGAFLINNKTLLLTEQGQFYYLNDEAITKWNIPADNELSSINVYSSLQLNDGSFILGTISNGIYHVDIKGNLLRIINQEKGLKNNTILSVFQDIEHNLWLGLDYGISIINLNSPFSVYTDLNGKIGTVYASIIFDNYLYLGTNQGLFFKRLNSRSDFKFINNTKGQVWCLKKIENTLFCGHNKGTYIVDKDVAIQISNFPGTWDIKKIENNNDQLLQGNYNGLSIIEKRNNQWQFKNRIEGFDISSRFFERLNDNQFIVNNEYKGIYKLNVDSLLRRVLNVENKAPNGYGSSLVNYKNELLYTSSNGVFKFNREQREFIKDSLLTDFFYSKDDFIQGTIISDNITNKLWGFSHKNIIVITPGKFINTPQVIKIPVPISFRRDLSLSGFECVTHLADEKYLIGAFNGYTVLNLNKLESNEYAVQINSIYKEFINGEKEQVSLINSNEFNSNENNLHFNFNVSEYDKYTEVTYQYQLEGLFDDWSNWFSDSNISLNNLRFGDYTFKVRAKIGNKLSSNIATYSFTIGRPWHFSNLMIVIYFLIFLIGLYVNYYFYKRHYNKKQEKLLDRKQQEFALAQLENEKVIMKLRNEKLRQEIESKNRELTISTMSIIKKNEILNSIKKELMLKHSEDINEYVIKTINKNINNKKDWEFIEDAFNNADKDFLKKIKKLHPNLTPNDLRFCAYLRLNLSSKEIAPLLNISVRSVEIKRYRLRKKLELLHEKSLIEYILGI